MVFLSGNESVQVFYHYICIAIRDSIIKRRRVDIPLNSLMSTIPPISTND
jgi:hypothetical protein